MNSGKSIKYKIGFMKIEGDPNDKLSLNKILYILVSDIVVESIYQANDEYHQQIYIDESEYECECKCE